LLSGPVDVGAATITARDDDVLSTRRNAGREGPAWPGPRQNSSPCDLLSTTSTASSTYRSLGMKLDVRGSELNGPCRY
jgi:hypothetical protein